MNITMTEPEVATPSTELTVQDRAMLAAIAEQFCVTNRQAFDWLYTFDFDATNELIEEEDEALN